MRRVLGGRGVVWVTAALCAAAALGAASFVSLGVSDERAFYTKWGVDPEHLPYHPGVDAREAIAAGKARAAAAGKFLMVTFGANWCPDCLTLHKNLQDSETRAYVDGKFEMVNIDVGDFDRNAHVARELGVTVLGIPLAVFFGPDGRPICDTRRGELEPSRHYTSREILGFLREVVEDGRAVSPDQRQ
jgi:protein disulfide-isomerase